MNQFHIDFDMFDEDGEKIKGLQNLCSVEAYFLGKKIYCHTLQAFKKYEDEKMELKQQMNRLKGISESSIKFEGGTEGTKQLYERLYNKETLNFDLTENGDKCGFKYENKIDMGVRSYRKGEFSRSVSVNPNVERIEVC